MELLQELLSNQLIVCGITGWAVAQVLKTMIHAMVTRKFDIRRIFGDGGMPSGHSATVTAMATCAAIQYGLGSFEFAVTVMLAIIVMHDAMGVRLETGKQAIIIKEISQLMEDMGKDISGEEKLKEFVGHTPMQVVAGAILGVCVALFWL